jgi:hypothetical protein
MSKFSIKHIFSGDILTKEWLKRQYKVILLISMLIFIYIHSGFKSQQQMLQINDLQKELQESKLSLQSLNVELIDKTRQSSICTMLEEQGSNIKSIQTPVIRIQ